MTITFTKNTQVSQDFNFLYKHEVFEFFEDNHVKELKVGDYSFKELCDCSHHSNSSVSCLYNFYYKQEEIGIGLDYMDISEILVLLGFVSGSLDEEILPKKDQKYILEIIEEAKNSER